MQGGEGIRRQSGGVAAEITWSRISCSVIGIHQWPGGGWFTCMLPVVQSRVWWPAGRFLRPRAWAWWLPPRPGNARV